jgi:hypothetical protein
LTQTNTLTVDDLKNRWKCSRATVYHYVTNGKRGVKLKTKFSPTQYLFVESDVREFEREIASKTIRKVKKTKNDLRPPVQ